jgi:hypothetical protein
MPTSKPSVVCAMAILSLDGTLQAAFRAGPHATRDTAIRARRAVRRL